MITQGCYAVFERCLKVCPACGLEIAKPTPAERTGPEHVDGDLYELDNDTLARMRGEVAAVDSPVKEPITQEELNEAVMAKRATYHHSMNPLYAAAAIRKFATKLQDEDAAARAEHEAQQSAVAILREIMATWAGYHRAAGRDDSEIFRRFYLQYGVDWLGAQTLKADNMITLGERVANDIGSV